MEISQINDLANSVMVARLELEALEGTKEALLLNNPQYQELLTQIESAKSSKEMAQGDLLKIMSEAQLKSWKTEKASFSRASRVSAAVDPALKKEIERSLKAGVAIDGWKLNEAEYLSIRVS